jgi:hypothetical protein
VVGATVTCSFTAVSVASTTDDVSVACKSSYVSPLLESFDLVCCAGESGVVVLQLDRRNGALVSLTLVLVTVALALFEIDLLAGEEFSFLFLNVFLTSCLKVVL